MNALIGIWFYTSLIYHGTEMPRPNEALKIYFTFENTSINEVFYYREGEHGTCRRKATYSVDGDKLIQKVISVDDANADFCGQDPDMQLGHESVTKFYIKNEKFYLELPLGEETLTYIWEKQDQ